jgi:hypothetical protein
MAGFSPILRVDDATHEPGHARATAAPSRSSRVAAGRVGVVFRAFSYEKHACND